MMEIGELIKQLQDLQSKYGNSPKIFVLNEVGSPVELTKEGIYHHTHKNQLQIFIEG